MKDSYSHQQKRPVPPAEGDDRGRGLEALEQLSRAAELMAALPLAGELDFGQVVAQAIRAVHSVLACERVSLFLVDESSETLHLYPASPYSSADGDGADVRVPLGVGVVGRVGETGEYLCVEGDAPDARSELCVPLKLGSWVIGVVDVQSSRPKAFEDQDVRLLRGIAGQLAIVLQSARLYQATRQRAAELSLLYDATVAISTADLDLPGMIDLVMNRLIRAVGVDGGRLALWDGATDLLMTRFASGPTLMEPPSGRGAQLVEEPLLRRLLAGRKPLPLYQDDPRLEPAVAQAMRQQGVQSALLLPLVAHNRVVGLVELTVQSARRRFSTDETRLALTLVTQAAIALENTRLYQETKRAVEELAALQALTLDITAQVTLPELLDRLMMRARHLVHAAGAAIYLWEQQELDLKLAASDLGWDAPGSLALARQAAQDARPLCQLVDASGVALSCACVPLRWREQRVGVLNVFRPDVDEPLGNQELYLLELLAPQAAIAIRNVQLFEALEQGMRDLEQAQANLVQAEKAAAIGRLTASLAHEINNPLQSLNNCLHLSLHRGLSPEKKGMYLEMAQEEVGRLIAIVNQVLNFYRPASGESRLEVDVNQLLNDVLALVSKQLEHSRVETELNLAPDLYILAIPNNLHQVFLNLILNAVDAMPAGGRLIIGTRLLDGEQVGITIRDTGRGIPPEQLARIAEPFFTTKEWGTGLGLAISYGIVEAHNGRIKVESVTGKGTTFLLQFPVGEVTGNVNQNRD